MSEVLSNVYSGDVALDKKINMWLSWDRNQQTLQEIQALVDNQDWTSLHERLDCRLTFGTAGLRGVMRGGFNGMNDLVIVQTAQGLCDYVVQQFPDMRDQAERGVVFGYDGRHNSKRFAELSACVFVHRGVRVQLYSRMVATPFVPFAVVQKKCLAGVMVTASHNPKDDNGYKVYWSNGAQIIAPHDKGIQQAILRHLQPEAQSWRTEILTDHALLADPYYEMFDLYYGQLQQSLGSKFIENNKNSEVRCVYTAMHGVGYPYVRHAFASARLPAVVPVEEQKLADPDFPTVKFPNPEEGKSALKLSFRKAEAEGITLIIANDPDADRLACAEQNETTHEWKVFNGNELGALLGWWSLQNFKALESDTKLDDCYMVASTVSSKILRAMSKLEGFHFEETLTGFKWIANRALELMAEDKQVLFAFEEAIGYMISTNVLDKDGISAACHLGTLISYLKNTRGITLTQKLDEIYDTYGYHCTRCSYLFCYDPELMQRIFDRLRNFGELNTYPQSILNGEFKIKTVRDLTAGVDTSQVDGRARLPCSKSSQMITFTFENGLVLTLRGSGTEPKLKYYAELCAGPAEKNRAHLHETLDRMVEAVIDEFLQPKLNKLTAKSD